MGDRDGFGQDGDLRGVADLLRALRAERERVTRPSRRTEPSCGTSPARARTGWTCRPRSGPRRPSTSAARRRGRRRRAGGHAPESPRPAHLEQSPRPGVLHDPSFLNAARAHPRGCRPCPRDGRGLDRSCARSQRPPPPNPSRAAKKGAPTKAVTTPIGSSPGATTVARPGRRAPGRPRRRSARPGAPPVRPARQPPHDVRHHEPDEPMRPLTATAAAVASEAAASTMSRTRCGRRPRVGRLLVADGQHVERAGRREQHHRRDDGVRQHLGEVTPAGLTQLPEDPGVDAAQLVGVGLLDERLDGRRNELTAIPASSRVIVLFPPPARPATVPSRYARPTPPRAPTKAAAGRPIGPIPPAAVGDDERRAQARARRRPEQVGVGERVAEDTLVAGAGHGQHAADEGDEQHPGQPQHEQDLRLQALQRGAHVHADLRQQGGDDLPRGEGDGAHRDPEDDRDEQQRRRGPEGPRAAPPPGVESRAFARPWLRALSATTGHPAPSRRARRSPPSGGPTARRRRRPRRAPCRS